MRCSIVHPLSLSAYVFIWMTTREKFIIEEKSALLISTYTIIIRGRFIANTATLRYLNAFYVFINAKVCSSLPKVFKLISLLKVKRNTTCFFS